VGRLRGLLVCVVTIGGVGLARSELIHAQAPTAQCCAPAVPPLTSTRAAATVRTVNFMLALLDCSYDTSAGRNDSQWSIRR
jgi:hypothetical protein